MASGNAMPRGWIAPLVLLILLASVPVAAAALDQPFLIRLFTRIIVLAIAAVALNLVLGFGGMVSLLHAGLFGVGAYTVAILAKHDFDGDALFGLFATADLALALPLAVVAAAAVAVLTGLVSLRTSGAYFIMITLAFNEMIYYLFIALQQYGGQDGLQVLSDLDFAGFGMTRRLPFYYVALGVLGLSILLVSRIVDSRFGQVLRATAQNERRVMALGIPPVPYRLAAFVISGALTGLAGGLWTAGQGFVSPADMSWVRSGDLVVMAVLGGMAAPWGPALGAVVFLVLESELSEWTTYWQLPLGLVIIFTIVLLRGGLAGFGAWRGLARR